MSTQGNYSADDIITEITEAETDKQALAMLGLLATPEMLRVIADQLHVDPDEQDLAALSQAIVDEARI